MCSTTTSYTLGMLIIQLFYKKYKSCNRNHKNVWLVFSFSSLKVNKTKCEIAGIGVRKGVKLAPCGMKCVNPNNDVIKILGISYSYDKKLENEKNILNHIVKLQNVLNIWRMRNLSLLDKTSVHLTLVTSVSSSTIDLLNKKQKDFLWDKKMQKLNIQPYVAITPMVA